jgi:thioredoxin-dependent peroxiredoxin
MKMAHAQGIPDAGSPAPAFSLPAEDGSTVGLAKLKGKTVVLYFYPKADTPGCTKEACGFRDTLADYTKRHAVVFGVSPDPVDAVKKFSDKFHLNFPLLADADHSVCEKYGVWQEKTNYGKTYMGVVRTTFVISPKGTIKHVFKNVKADGHEQEVLKWLSENPD